MVLVSDPRTVDKKKAKGQKRKYKWFEAAKSYERALPAISGTTAAQAHAWKYIQYVTQV